MMIWIAISFVLLASTRVDSLGSAYDKNFIGVASIDRAVPLFAKNILTLGSVALNTTGTQRIIITFPLRDIVLSLPPEANQRQTIFFDAEDDHGDNVQVEIAYLSGNWYHGSFASGRSTVNFIYQLTNNTRHSVEAFRKLWKNPNIN